MFPMKRLLLCVVLLACSGTSGDVLDGGDDASVDQSTGDAAPDAIADVALDAVTDASEDSPADVASDAGAGDAGDAGSICGVCQQKTVCCTIPNAVDYGKCYNPSCLSCCM